MLVVGLIDIQHMQSVIKGFFFLKNCYYFSDLEIQWPRNPELKSKWDFACLQHLSEGVSHNIEEKKSQLCFRASTKPLYYIFTYLLGADISLRYRVLNILNKMFFY